MADTNVQPESATETGPDSVPQEALERGTNPDSVPQEALERGTNPDSDAQPESVQTEEERLKYLNFAQWVMLQGLLYASKAYGYAKENSGPLKSRVETMEGTVKNVVGPVYDKYNGVPVDVLKFVDRKVDESVKKLDGRVPPLVKNASTRVFSAAQNATVSARSMENEVKSNGVLGTASGLAKTAYTKYEPAAKELYSKYEPVAEQYANSAWNSLNQLPLFPRVAKVAVPAASYFTEKYNQTVQKSQEKGYAVSSYLPLVPHEKIAKVFKGRDEVAAAEPAAAEAVVPDAEGAAVAAH